MSLEELIKEYPIDDIHNIGYMVKSNIIYIITENDKKILNKYDFKVQLNDFEWQIFEIKKEEIYNGYLYDGLNETWSLAISTWDGWIPIIYYKEERKTYEELIVEVKEEIKRIESNK